MTTTKTKKISGKRQEREVARIEALIAKYQGDIEVARNVIRGGRTRLRLVKRGLVPE